MLQPTLEPFSSVSFQHKQQTSPLPTHHNEQNPYPLFKSYDLNGSSSSTFLPDLSTASTSSTSIPFLMEGYVDVVLFLSQNVN
ncbi:unnamed protein product [Cunninghamella echinulata]